MRWHGAAVAGLVLLTACSRTPEDGPSDEDMKVAFARAGVKNQDVQRIACTHASDRPGYVCDYKAAACSTFGAHCGEVRARIGRFVGVGDSWMYMGDMPDPTRGVLAPSPAPVLALAPGTTPPPTMTPSATPSAVPSATPSPTPSPSATLTPKHSATPTPTPKHSPTPTPTPTPNAAKTPAGVGTAWLVGRWGRGTGGCADGAEGAIRFRSDGLFHGRRGMGRWQLKGDAVTIWGPAWAQDKGKVDAYRKTLPTARLADDKLRLDGDSYRRCE